MARKHVMAVAPTWFVFLAVGVLLAGTVVLVRLEGTPVVFEPPEPRVEDATAGTRVKVPLGIRNVSTREVTIVGAHRG